MDFLVGKLSAASLYLTNLLGASIVPSASTTMLLVARVVSGVTWESSQKQRAPLARSVFQALTATLTA